MINPHILLTTDFSEASLRAFAPTVELARNLDGSITLLHVVSELVVIPHGSPLAPAQEPPDLAEEIEKARKQLEEARERLGGQVEVKTALEIGEKVDAAITDYANANEIDMIAIATHGRSGIRRMVLGSVTEGVLRRARTPVVAFPT